MRILHTADWHLGKKLYDTSRLGEQKAVLEEICQIADDQQVDAILIAGDLYDTFNPPTEAIELFYKTLHKLAKQGQRPVIAIAGNHDSADRIQAPDSLAKECGILLVGYPNSKIEPFKLDTGLTITKSDEGFIELKVPQSEEKLRILLTPYANEARLKSFFGTQDSEEDMRQQLGNSWKNLAEQYCDESGINVLISHLFMMEKGGKQPEEPEDERSVLHIGGAQVIYTENIPPQIQYTALGHLHRHHFVGNKERGIAYSGSLLSYSFSEANQDKYVLIVDIDANQQAKVGKVPLQSGRKLFRKKFDLVEEALEWLNSNPNCYVELTLVTDEFLEASVKKQLINAHDGIMAIIPEIRKASSSEENKQQMDLSQNRLELFKEYFAHKNAGQQPNESLLSILKEALDKE